jgi:hypothetical protein
MARNVLIAMAEIHGWSQAMNASSKKLKQRPKKQNRNNSIYNSFFKIYAGLWY